jgi:hypothetical protein
MGDGDGVGLKLDNDDRLPWLEPALEESDYSGVSPVKIVTLVVFGLVLLGIIVGGGYWLKYRYSDTAADSSKLIPAQGGDYKIPVEGADGKAFKGTGDTSYATSEGVDTNGKVDASRMPEAPMAGVSRGSIAKDDGAKAHAAAAKPAASVSSAVKDETKAVSKTTPVVGSGSGGGAMIQLGAYGSEAVAQDSWKKLAKRFDYLAALGSTVQKAEVGGSTVYRLRASAGSAANASTLCGRLKVAGENCIVVK